MIRLSMDIRVFLDEFNRHWHQQALVLQETERLTLSKAFALDWQWLVETAIAFFSGTLESTSSLRSDNFHKAFNNSCRRAVPFFLFQPFPQFVVTFRPSDGFLSIC
jgi:hypothetical protein